MGFADREQKRKSVLDKMLDTADIPEPASDSPPLRQNELVIRHKRETRSRKANFLIKPSTYEKASARCKELDISLNECINQLLEQWLNS